MTEGMTTAVGNAMNTVKGDVMDMITTALPYALAILGVGLAITLGVRFFKKIAGK